MSTTMATIADARSTWKTGLATLLGLAVAALFLAACDGGGGGGSSSGSSTVIGNVDSFDGGTRLYLPQEGRTWYAHVMDFLLPAAEAAVGGVTVSVAGQSGTTAEDGLFVISGVPPGTHVLELSFNGQTAFLTVDVPANATVDIKNIRVGPDGSVGTGSVEVEIHPDSSEDDNSNANDNADDTSSDSDVDDNSNDNSSVDDESDGTSNDNEEDDNSNDNDTDSEDD